MIWFAAGYIVGQVLGVWVIMGIFAVQEHRAKRAWEKMPLTKKRALLDAIARNYTKTIR